MADAARPQRGGKGTVLAQDILASETGAKGECGQEGVKCCGVLPVSGCNFREESQRSQRRRQSQKPESEESGCQVGELEEHDEGLKSPWNWSRAREGQ